MSVLEDRLVYDKGQTHKVETIQLFLSQETLTKNLLKQNNSLTLIMGKQ
jgi:hypothetical protein